MVWVVPIARATFDRFGVVLGGGETLPEECASQSRLAYLQPPAQSSRR